MIALAVAGCLVGGLALLALLFGVVLALRQRRLTHQPRYPPYRPAPPARRHADLRAHPQDAEIQEIPTIPGGAHQ